MLSPLIRLLKVSAFMRLLYLTTATPNLAAEHPGSHCLRSEPPSTNGTHHDTPFPFHPNISRSYMSHAATLQSFAKALITLTSTLLCLLHSVLHSTTAPLAHDLEAFPSSRLDLLRVTQFITNTLHRAATEIPGHVGRHHPAKSRSPHPPTPPDQTILLTPCLATLHQQTLLQRTTNHLHPPQPLHPRNTTLGARPPRCGLSAQDTLY